MAKAESSGNIPTSQLATLLIQVKPETNLQETLSIFMCHTCNNLGLGRALSSKYEEALAIISHSIHAGHELKIQTETEFYKNWEIEPGSVNAETVLQYRKELMKAGGIMILRNS